MPSARILDDLEDQNVVPIKLMWDADADTSLGLPAYATPGAAGADLRAQLRGRDIVLEPGKRVLVPTGLRMAIPPGFEVQIRPRSGLTLKHGITIPNAPGTIDSDYRGPVGVILLNLGDGDFVVSHGMRIAQMVVAPVVVAQFELEESLEGTARGGAGFGSTGVN